MLKIIEVLLSFAVVMLLVSGLVMILTQFINRFSFARGFCLIFGLGRLLEHVEPALGCFRSKFLAWRLLCNPISGGALSIFPGDYINKEDFITLLLERGAKLYTEPKSPNENVPANPLQVALARNGISNPEATLSDICKTASQIELRNPSLSIRERQKIALAQAADNDFIAKINLWFDQTVDRVSDTFTAWTRIVTLVFSLALAAAINLNSVDLVEKLLIDDKTRDGLVEKAIKAQSSSDDELLLLIRDCLVEKAIKAQSSSDDELLLLIRDCLDKKAIKAQSSSDDELFGEGDLEVVPSLINKLQTDSSQTRLISQLIWEKINQATKTLLADPNLTAPKKHRIFVRALNNILEGESIYEPARFDGVILRPETQSLITQNPADNRVIRLNRMLMEDAYPKDINVNQSSSNGKLFGESDFKVEPSLITKLQSDSSQSQLVSQLIWEKINQATKKSLADPNSMAPQRQRIFVQALNNILKDKSIYEPARFDGVILRPETQSLITQNPTDNRLIRLNRLLMEDAYPMEIARNQFEYFAAQFRNQGLDGLVKLGLIQDPKLWKWENVRANLVNPGIILSGLLLSLGAPFWYNLLKSLLNFRGRQAMKDEKQEKEQLRN